VIVVTGGGKRAIADHFDRNWELEFYLKERGKDDLLKVVHEVEELAEKVDIAFIEQREPLGLGHAVWTARRLVGDAPVAVLLPDDVMLGPEPVIGQLMRVHEERSATVLGVRRFPRQQISRYGAITTPTQSGPVYEVKDVVEKPKPEEAPSELAMLGRYVLNPDVLVELERTDTGAGGEIQLTDGIKRTVNSGRVVALEFEGEYYDTGTVATYLKANLSLALSRPDMREEMSAYVRELAEKQTSSSGAGARI
jgi:UTP--glucose-1-phosphate uridylyltransferase